LGPKYLFVITEFVITEFHCSFIRLGPCFFYLVDHVAHESEPDEEGPEEGPEDHLEDTHFFVTPNYFSQYFLFPKILLELLHVTVTSFRSVDKFFLHKHLIRFALGTCLEHLQISLKCHLRRLTLSSDIVRRTCCRINHFRQYNCIKKYN